MTYYSLYVNSRICNHYNEGILAARLVSKNGTRYGHFITVWPHFNSFDDAATAALRVINHVILFWFQELASELFSLPYSCP